MVESVSISGTSEIPIGVVGDENYIPVVKVIISGMQESMMSSGVTERNVESLKSRLIEFSRGLYKELWLEHAREDEDSENLDLDGESKSATFYSPSPECPVL